jgi:hypothetical protein
MNHFDIPKKNGLRIYKLKLDCRQITLLLLFMNEINFSIL